MCEHRGDEAGRDRDDDLYPSLDAWVESLDEVEVPNGDEVLKIYAVCQECSDRLTDDNESARYAGLCRRCDNDM